MMFMRIPLSLFMWWSEGSVYMAARWREKKGNFVYIVLWNCYTRACMLSVWYAGGVCYLILLDVLDLFVDSKDKKLSFSIVKTGTSKRA